MGAKVDILLSTYNGSKYVGQLIDSILQQTYPEIRLLIRDDGSKDRTPEILRSYQEKYRDTVRLLQDQRGNLGVTGGMFALLRESDADYWIFCDQDDVWFRDKTERLVKAIKSKEKRQPDLPILVHCDAYTTDENLKLVDDEEKRARMSYQSGRDKLRTSFANLLLCNPVQGASMIGNRALRNELKPVLDVKLPKTLLYDSLTASVCSIRGKIFFLPEPLMYYRQHGGNLVGASKTYLFRMRRYQGKELDAVKTANFLLVNRTKCQVLKKYYGKRLNGRQKDILSFYLSSPNGWIQFLRLGLVKEFRIRQIGIMLLFGVH